jgi:exonuclease SbcC
VRPVRIELEGFSAYRSRVEVDLSAVAGSDVALFSLSGATGAGKSSLVDALIFGLYGRIPRLDGRAVAPVISAGTDRARVRVDFEVDGVVHTAVRLVQRTSSGGASIREARLQRGEEVLASGADNVTAAVEELLRLGFEDFTRTVVLPQGKFSQFLDAAPRARQDLLRDLLGLEVYGRVRELANRRKDLAEGRAESARNRLEGLQVPDEAAVEEARQRLHTLEAMAGAVAEEEKRLSALTAAVETADREVARLRAGVERLDQLEAPHGLEELGEMVTRARDEDADAREALERAQVAVAAIEAEREEAADAEALALARRAHDELDELDRKLSALDPAPSQSALVAAEVALAEAKAVAGEVAARLSRVHTTHAAHVIAATLVVGESCPVCHHPVEALPESETPEDLTAVQVEVEAAGAVVERCDLELSAARRAVADLEASRAVFQARREELAIQVAAAPDRDELARLDAVVDDLKRRHAGARATLADAGARVKEAGKALEELASREGSIGRLLQSALLAVAAAGLDPPVSESDDVVVQWKDLLAWRETSLDRAVSELSGAEEATTEARNVFESARQGLVEQMASMGLAAVEPFTATLAAETERARQLVVQHEKALADGTALQEQVETESATAAVAGALAGHLRADGFERWMMAGALHTLVVGANELLAQLSDGGYSLHSEEGTFTVIDHRNADERRSVSTLSGGETFLVSLALALSLAETLAGSGGARLDAIILDEGFGTLDDESLDTVAGVLEELAGQGLMVGVITHVKELASRATVRYEVTRGAKGSTVSEVT